MVDSPVGRLGLSICYDLRFPEMYVDMVQRGGAEVLLVPSAFTVPTGRAHWHALLRGEKLKGGGEQMGGPFSFGGDTSCPSASSSSSAVILARVRSDRLLCLLHGGGAPGCYFYFFSYFLIARAIENQCYVLAAAQYGAHSARRESYGHSLAVDPWGEIVSDAGGSDGPGTVAEWERERDDEEAAGMSMSIPTITLCDVDLDALRSVRERMPIRAHRERSTYTLRDSAS